MKKIYIVSALVCTLLLSSCSTGQAYQNRTGFFNAYEGLENKARTKSLFFERMPDANLSAYDKILIPQIKVLANTSLATPAEHELYTQISDYSTAAYRKNIIKNSANYELVDVPQKNTIIMQIAISMVEVHNEDREWDGLSALAFSLNVNTYGVYQEGNARLLIEARISDAMSAKLLARSMRVIDNEKVMMHTADRLGFKDVQNALDTWLNHALVKH